MNCLRLFDENFHDFLVIPTLFLDEKLEDSLNGEIKEPIIELKYIDPKREEQPSNLQLTVVNSVVRYYDKQQLVNSGRNYGRSRGYYQRRIYRHRKHRKNIVEGNNRNYSTINRQTRKRNIKSSRINPTVDT